MYGQGSPPKRRVLRHLRVLLGIALIAPCAVGAEPLGPRVRIVWGGGESRLWQGAISLSGGTISDLRVLGLEADQTGAFVRKGRGHLLVQPRMAHRYAGIEVRLSGADDAILRVALTPDRDSQAASEYEIAIGALKRSDQQVELDDKQNVLRISRAPGDDLQVRFERDSMVFGSNELFRFDFLAKRVNAKPNSTLRVVFDIVPSVRDRTDVTDFWLQDDNVVWSQTENMQLDGESTSQLMERVETRLPEEEGAYVLRIRAFPKRGLSVGFAQQKPVAERHVQFIVIDERSPRVYGGGDATLVTEFNPADPRWYERLTQLPQWRLLPTKRRGPWFDEPPQSWDEKEQSWTQLGRDGWIAYSLPVSRPGLPHALELQLPAKQQSIGVSILEPNALGELSPVSLDSGVIVGDPDLELPNVSVPTDPIVHRLVFWPRTSSPVVLITNQQSGRGPVSFGRIRLEVYKRGLPTERPHSAGGRERFAYLHRQLVKHIFLAPDVRNGDEHFSVDDWNTFYQATRRLVEYLRYAGYDGVVLPAVSDGSALYPSSLLNPTPKHDRGVFSSLGSDPVRKDILEMMFRVFDREGLVLIPSMEFSSPLASLEQETVASYPEVTGIELTSIDGRRWYDLVPHYRGAAPYYNPLDPRVRSAILALTQEITNRYIDHPSYGGVQLNLTERTYTHLPDVDWGADTNTLEAFSLFLKEQGEELSVAELKARLANAIELRESQESSLMATWLSWRAEQLTKFYRDISGFVTRSDNHRLYLSTSQLAQSEPWKRRLRPALPRQANVEDAMLDLGLDTDAISQLPRVVLMRPERVAPLDELGTQGVNLEVAGRDASRSFATGALSVSQFHHETQELRLESFDRHGPFGGGSYTLLWSHLGHGGAAARRQFARSLARHDDQVIFAGGRGLVMGQEDALRSYFEVFRSLPSVPFQTLPFAAATPVTVRLATFANQSYVYLVNDSPWPVDISLEWDADGLASAQSLGKHELHSLGEQAGSVLIEPYGLAGLRFNQPTVRLLACRSQVPPEVSAHLRYQLNLVTSRVDQVMKSSPVDLIRNASFEEPIQQPGSDWFVESTPGSLATVEKLGTAPHGRSALRIDSQGTSVLVSSHTFSAPKTGRLHVSFRARCTSPKPLELEMSLRSNRPYRPAQTFVIQPGNPEFVEFSKSFNDLPNDPNLLLRLTLQARGEGTIWIDDIKSFDKSFEKNEQHALDRLLQVAHHQFNNGDLAGCYETLGGYWPRFLLRHVPPPIEVATRPVVPASAKRVEQKQSMLDRLRRNTARLLRF